MIRTIWVWCTGIVLTVILGVLLILFSFLDPTDKVIHFLAQVWARGVLAAAGVKVHVQGLENLPRDQPQILASNHQSVFDIFALFAYIPIKFGWFAKKELYRIPLFGYTMKRFGNICIDRSNREKARMSLDIAAQKVSQGASVIIFPEGTRSRDGEVLPFKKGCYYLAEASGAPVVPISISGSFKIMHKKDFRVYPGEIHLVIGQPIYATSDRKGFMDRLRQTIIDNQVPVH